MTDQYTTAQDNYRYYRYCRDNGHDQYLIRAESALTYFVGQQWTQEELADMKATNRPALVINKMFRTIDTLVGHLMEGAGDVQFTAAQDGGEGAASSLDKLWVHTEQMSHLRDRIDRNVALSGLLTGRGFYDIRVDFDDQMQGNVVVAPRRPQNVVLDPEIDQVDPKTWSQVFTTMFMNYDEIALAYGAPVAKELEQTPQSSWLAPYDLYVERALAQRFNGGVYYDPREGDPKLLRCRRVIERQYKSLATKEFFVDTETGDMSIVPASWPRERVQELLRAVPKLGTVKKRTEIVKWRVTCDRFVLHDAESPYKTFTIVPFMPYFVDGYTYSLGELLTDNQRVINKITSQILHILNSAANSGWKVKKGSLKNMTDQELEETGARTGLVAVLDDVNDLERIQPGAMPNGHEAFAQNMESMFYEIAGYTDAMRGDTNPRTSGKALGYTVDQGIASMQGAFSAFNTARSMLAETALDYYQTYYTETRLIRIAGSDTPTTPINQPQPDGSVLNDITVGKYLVTVIPVPARRLAEQNAFQQLMDMRKDLGIMIPDSVLIQHSTLPGKAAILEAIKGQGNAAQMMEQQQQQLELEELTAKVGFTKAQSALAEARAQRASMESTQDHKGDQIAMETQRMSLDHTHRMADIGLRRETAQQQTASSLAATSAKVHDTNLNAAVDLHKDANKTAVALATTHATLKHQERLSANKPQQPQEP